MINNTWIYILLFVAISLSAFFSGSETGFYQISKIRLRLAIEKKRFLYIILGKCVHSGNTMLMSILAGTNLSNYLATNLIAYILFSFFQDEQTTVLVTTIITTTILFIFAELIPKNIFYFYADSIMPYVAPLLYVSKKIFTYTLIVPILNIFSKLFGTNISSQPSIEPSSSASIHPHVRAIIQETKDENILSSTQTDIIDRLAEIAHLKIISVMTHLNQTQTLELNSNRSLLIHRLNKYSFTRYLVYEQSFENIVGFVNIYEPLCSDEEFTDLRRFVKPIKKFSSEISVSTAIKIMQQEKFEIALVMKKGPLISERPIGIITMKDLIEELLGELVEW